MKTLVLTCALILGLGLDVSAFGETPKSFPKTTDIESVQFKLYRALFAWGTESEGARGIKVSERAAKHGDRVKAGVSLYYRFVSVDDSKNSLTAEYNLSRNRASPRGWDEAYTVKLKLESTELPKSDDPHSLQAILFEALPKPTRPDVAELSDAKGNRILCEATGGYRCSFVVMQ